MKFLSFHPMRYLMSCIIMGLMNLFLFQVMAHTRIIEKVMAFQCSWWEFLLIAMFLIVRLFTYVIVPPALGAIAVWLVLKKAYRPKSM